MEKAELRLKLEETKAKIKSNSRDAHFADALISDLLSLKGQIDHEPTMLHIPVSSVEETFDGEHFEMYTTNDGTAVYHTRGGYTLIADPRCFAINQTIKNFIDASKNLDSIPEEDRNIWELELRANAHVLNIPMVAFCDGKLKLELATAIVNYLRTTYEDALNSPLQDDDIAANREFEDRVKSTLDLSDELKEAAKQ